MSRQITLEELLASRDERWAMEQKLIKDYPGKTEIVLTVVMPGQVKRDERSLAVASEAVKAITSEFGSEPVVSRDLPTGFEAYWVVAGDGKALKLRTCRIEESHPLGRLFDIDVMFPDATPISRQSVGLPPRRCLVCNKEARFCMRNHTHSQAEIQQKINEMVAPYLLDN